MASLLPLESAGVLFSSGSFAGLWHSGVGHRDESQSDADIILGPGPGRRVQVYGQIGRLRI